MNIQRFCCPECFHVTDNPSWSDLDDLIEKDGEWVHSHRHIPICPRCHEEARVVGPWMEDHPQKVAHAVLRDVGPIPARSRWRRLLDRFKREG